MVKVGGELPGEGATAVIHASQTLSMPEWTFSTMDRPKTKRIGTPYPVKSRRALKRAGLETGSEVSRAKKMMMFELADNLVAERHGEGRRSPEVEQACVGEMLNALAQMAKEGSTPTCELKEPECEGVAGTSPAPANRNDDVPSEEMVLVNLQHVEGTRDHVNPCLDVGVTCEELDACDSQMRERTRLTLHGEGSVGSFLVSGNLNSNSTPCATHPPPLPIGHDEHNGDRPPDAQLPENSPENQGSPAGAWKVAKVLHPQKGSGSVEGESALKGRANTFG